MEMDKRYLVLIDTDEGTTAWLGEWDMLEEAEKMLNEWIENNDLEEYHCWIVETVGRRHKC